MFVELDQRWSNMSAGGSHKSRLQAIIWINFGPVYRRMNAPLSLDNTMSHWWLQLFPGNMWTNVTSTYGWLPKRCMILYNWPRICFVFSISDCEKIAKISMDKKHATQHTCNSSVLPLISARLACVHYCIYLRQANMPCIKQFRDL